MIGLVIVSHSAKLAEGVCELVRAGGAGPGAGRCRRRHGRRGQPLGTDAFKVVRPSRRSTAPTACWCSWTWAAPCSAPRLRSISLDEEKRSRVRLCAAPLVEGAVAAAAQIVAGAGMDEVERDAGTALAAKTGHMQTHPRRRRLLQPASPPALKQSSACAIVSACMPGRRRSSCTPPGASRRRFMLRDVTTDSGPVPANSISQVLGLGVRQGHQSASAPRARRQRQR